MGSGSRVRSGRYLGRLEEAVKHCKTNCGEDFPPSECLCKFVCAFDHCGCVSSVGVCCLCGWSTWKDEDEIAERREVSFVSLALMGFSL